MALAGAATGYRALPYLSMRRWTVGIRKSEHPGQHLTYLPVQENDRLPRSRARLPSNALRLRIKILRETPRRAPHD